jgi:GNAT superfamily N-acetyltransferase
VFESEPLRDDHDLSGFDSGQPELDDWLRHSALRSDAKRISRTYVWHSGDSRVISYFALCPHVIERSALPGKLARGDPDRIPSLLLAKLALDRQLHGQRLGAQLLLDALGRAVAASDRIGGRYVIVDAIDDAAAEFYAHYGFQPCPGEDLRRLVRKVSDISRSLGLRMLPTRQSGA